MRGACMRYEAIHSFVMLRGAKDDESLLRLRTAASSTAVRRTVPIMLKSIEKIKAMLIK